MVDNNQGVLLNSGATHIPRGPYDETEWMQAVPHRGADSNWEDAVENVTDEQVFADEG